MHLASSGVAANDDGREDNIDEESALAILHVCCFLEGF